MTDCPAAKLTEEVGVSAIVEAPRAAVTGEVTVLIVVAVVTARTVGPGAAVTAGADEGALEAGAPGALGVSWAAGLATGGALSPSAVSSAE
jgi:hypothetical protein